ncbi:MAG: hypothetical protein JNK44_16395 [Cyclobacteriaceae bacterium]|nr:hypothetical protein [Cyclobacteriaceae bacterium]
MKVLKLVLLLMALALPVLIFMFLKFFGKNEFAVEPLYQDGAPAVEGCIQPPKGAYVIQPELLSNLGWSEKDSLTLFYVVKQSAGAEAWGRIRENFTPEELPVLKITAAGILKDSMLNEEFVQVPSDSLQILKRCFLFLQEPYDLLLVDNKRRIRGHYPLHNREEIDRLIMEVEIILRKY